MPLELTKGAYVQARIDGRDVRAVLSDISPDGLQVSLDYVDNDGDWVEDVEHPAACLVRVADIADWPRDGNLQFNVWEFGQAAAAVLRAQADNETALDNIEYMLEKPWKFRHEAWLGGCDGLEKS